MFPILRNGGKVDRNPQGSVNVNPRTLEEYFFEDCIKVNNIIKAKLRRKIEFPFDYYYLCSM